LLNWGFAHNYVAEYTYPHDQAIKWLSGNITSRRLLLTGQYSHYYGLNYYLKKYKFYPKISVYPFRTERFDPDTEWLLINSFFDKFEKGEIDQNMGQVDAILYHSVNNINLDFNVLYAGKFQVVKRIQNSTHSLFILKNIKYND